MFNVNEYCYCNGLFSYTDIDMTYKIRKTKNVNSIKKRCVTIFNKNPSFFDECINVTCIYLFEIHIWLKKILL